MKRAFIFFIILLSFTSVIGQKIITDLPDIIKESSGLVALNDSTFITINDSGNNPFVYVINQRGEILNVCSVENAKNKDWEDLCLVDDSMLYIADFGNNSNQRKDLRIFLLPLAKVLHSKSAIADSINFKYPDQLSFPPAENEKYYDAEALSYYQDKLWIFTKNRTSPFDGLSKVYSLPKKSGFYEAERHKDLKLKATNWMEECVTSSCINSNHLFILTYTKVYIYRIGENNLNYLKTIELNRFGQWESISVLKNMIYLTEEEKFTEAKLYKLRWK